ncbi:MAG: tetratricopeptide repeat protein [Acidobacteriaceae bacterium]|jgi:tetratricopeptide (TPR) repeat protein|nr:tetratricopeptide repeat protein [Acidobacteriaceae bacterium]
MKALVFVAVLGLVAPVAAVAQPRRPSRPAPPPAAPAQQAPAPVPAQSGGKADVYELFLHAHAIEDEDVDGAIAAYKRAMELDPKASAIPADLADLYMREERPADAIAMAEQALAITPDDHDAHLVLGTVYASMLGGQDAQNLSRAERQEYVTKAIQHLEQSFEGSINSADPNMRALLARLYIATNMLNKAIPILVELIKQEPQWSQGPDLLIEAYTDAGRAAEAKTWLEENAPDAPQLYLQLGDIYVRERHYDEAVDAFNRALAVSPRNAALRVRLAQALLASGGREDAVRARDVLREITGPRIPDDALYFLSRAERLSGDSGAAAETARRLITQNNQRFDAYEALAAALMDQRKFQSIVDVLAPVVEQAATTSTPATRGNSNNATRTLVPYLGYAYQELGQFDKAIATFEAAQKALPNDPSFTGYLIQAQMAAKNYSAAAELARKARADRPGDLRLARLESLALRSGGKVDAGLAVLEDFVKAQSENVAAVVSLAQAYSETNRGAKAIETLRGAQTKFPGESSITFELGMALDRQKKYAEAEAVFRDLIAKEPDNAAALNYLGYMLAERGGRINESVDLINRALALDPGNGSYLDSLGWAYFKDGKFDLALDPLQKAAGQLTANSVVQEHYGDLLFKLGRIDAAIEAWDKALSGDGDGIDKGGIDRKIRSARQKLPK